MIVHKFLTGKYAASIRCRSGLGVSLVTEDKRDAKGQDMFISVSLDTDPKNVEGWHKDWLPYGDFTKHKRPQIYYGVPYALADQLIRANGGPVE